MANISCTFAVSEGVRRVEVGVEGSLTTVNAASLCRAVREHLELGAQSFLINLENVKAVDPVGLAAILQSARLAERLGARITITPGPAAYRALLAARLVSEFPLVSSENPASLLLSGSPVYDIPASQRLFVATNKRLGLRLPTWEDLALLERWAHEPLLDQMVGSDFLYVCRTLGAHHPDFTPLVWNDPTALTLLIQPLGSPAAPVGYVRLYNINLVEQFAFLETAVADFRSLRKGWGIEASRLLLAFAQDALGLCRVEAKVYAYNVLSINALKRNGFAQEGVLRQARSYDGQRWDILLFSILEEEMREQRKQDGFPYMGFWRGRRDDLP